MLRTQEVIVNDAERIATETERYRRYRYCAVFPAVPILTLSVFQKVYLLSVPTSWWSCLSGRRVADTLLTDFPVDCSARNRDIAVVTQQLEEDVISTLQVDTDFLLAKDQQRHLLESLSVQRHVLQSLVDSTACHELPIGSVQLPIFDVFADITPCLARNDECALPRDEYRFWQLVSCQIYTDELGREIVRSQTQPEAAARPDLQECLRYLVVEQTIPSLISKPPEAKLDIEQCTRYACLRLENGEDYVKLLDRLVP